jgi:hypothetical protein
MWYETTSSGNNRIVLRSSLDAGDPFVDKIVIDNSAGAPDSSHLAVSDYYVSIIWQRDNEIYFRQQSRDDWRVFTQKINLSSNDGDSYSPKISAYGPKVVAVWTDESFGNNSEIAFMDITPLVYFEYPLYSGFKVSTDGHSQIMNVRAGDNVTVKAVIDNYKERISADAIFVLQVLNDEGIAEFVSVSNLTILPEERSALVTFTWSPKQSGWKTIEGFLWSNDSYALATKIEDQRLVVGSGRDYNLILQHELEKTRVLAGESVNGSLYLINDGNQTQFVTVDAIYSWSSPFDTCNYFQSSELYEPKLLPPGSKMNLTETITWMQWHPKTYNSTWYAVLSVKTDDDSKADCLQLASNSVPFEVIPRPSPEGVSLVLSTDKQEYRRNETIHFTAYVDNNAGRPFELSDFEFGISFTDKTGKEIASLTWVSPHGNAVVKPYSRLAVPLYDAMWDQTYPDLDGRWIQTPAGEYTVHAEYWPPFLKSQPLAITITE